MLLQLIKYICKVLIAGTLTRGEENKDAIVHIPRSRPLGLLFHIEQFQMQLQGTTPIECKRITKQHGGTVFTEEITHYATVSHKKIFQLHLHCICIESKWLMGIDHYQMKRKKRWRKKRHRWRSSIFILMLTSKMWPAYKFTLW